jgi:outer membrane protein assembly factor BamB
MILGKIAGCAGCIVGLSLAAAVPGDWPSWRGPSAQGSVSSGRFPERWSADSVTWKAELPGKGTSTPVVDAGRIYLTSPLAGQDAFIAFDLQGCKLWETPVGPLADPRHRTLGSSCNASPATDGQAIYAQFKSGHFAAVSRDGKVLWKVDLTERFGAEKLYWDSGTSPLIAGDSVILLSLIHI